MIFAASLTHTIHVDDHLLLSREVCSSPQSRDCCAYDWRKRTGRFSVARASSFSGDQVRGPGD